ncbi:MAG: CopD family protein [Gemmatimonadota bacterium]
MLELALPVAQRGLLFASTLLVTGAVVWKRAIAPSLAAESLDPAPLIHRVARLGTGSALLLLAVWGLRLVIQLHDFRDPFVPVQEDLAFLLGETFWGTVWVAQGVVTGILILAFMRRGWRLAEWGVVFLALTLSLSSHAMSVPFNRPLAVAVDASHLLAAGAWMGTLALILLISRGKAPHLAVQLRAFSPLAMGAVGVLIFMGVVLSGVHLGELRSLWASSYGRILVGKILLAGGVLLLGFLNWRRGLPALDTPEGARRIRRRATWEVALAAAVLVATAVLTGTPMPEGVH